MMSFFSLSRFSADPGPDSSNRFSDVLSSLILGALVCCLLFGSGCNQQEKPYRKQTTPVTGMVVVDGQPPDSAIKVVCHPLAGIDQKHPSVSQAMTDENGVFKISTYEQGDGVPPGEYALTFYWGKVNLASMSYGGPDRLKKRYSQPETSEFKLSVIDQQPVNLGLIELTTK